MKILIFGGTRFIGKHLVKLFLYKKYQLTIISKKKIKLKQKNITFINLERSKGIEKIKNKNYDLCFDFIAYNKKDPIEVFKNINVAKYIMISTTWIPMYLNKKSNELCQYNKNLFKKIDAHNLTKRYLKGKILSENEINKLRKKRFVGIILRLPIIFGFNDHTKRLDFYFSRFKKRKKIYLLNKGNNFIQFCWYEDIAKALKKWSLKPNIEKKIVWEALPSKSIQLKILVKYLANIYDKKIKFYNISKKKILKINKNYIKNEPFFREKKIKISQNNIFNFLNYKISPIHESLKKLSKYKNNY